MEVCRIMGNEELAKRMAAAAISYQMGVTYQTAYKNYITKTPGQLWFLLAELAMRGMAEAQEGSVSTLLRIKAAAENGLDNNK